MCRLLPDIEITEIKPSKNTAMVPILFDLLCIFLWMEDHCKLFPIFQLSIWPKVRARMFKIFVCIKDSELVRLEILEIPTLIVRQDIERSYWMSRYLLYYF